jgi:Molybdopterin-binding domain of aldehyde dehydrogenase
MDDPGMNLASADFGALTGLTSETPYNFGVVRSSTHVVKTDISIGIWRGVTHNGSVFALESAISEMALADNLNEVEMRTKLLAANPRFWPRSFASPVGNRRRRSERLVLRW